MSAASRVRMLHLVHAAEAGLTAAEVAAATDLRPFAAPGARVLRIEAHHAGPATGR
jgi:hypothetical protein